MPTVAPARRPHIRVRERYAGERYAPPPMIQGLYAQQPQRYAAVASYPGPQSVFVKTFDASGRLTVDFSRNTRDFLVNRYAQIQPVTKLAGYYRSSTVEEEGRILNTNLSDRMWADGAPRPDFYGETESSVFLTYSCKRYAWGVTLGDLTIDQADWSLTEEYSVKKAQQAMTGRTQLMLNTATTVANWTANAANHTIDVTTINDSSGQNTGKWSASTTVRQDVKRSLNYGANQCLLDTLGAINVNDLMLVISPNSARGLAQTQEMVDHIKGSPDALAQVRGELPGENAIFGLPDKLYGYPILVEKTVKTTSRKGATRAVSYVMPDATPLMVSRPGSLMGKFGAPSFSTLCFFMFEEMSTEVLHEPLNRRTVISIVENYDQQILSYYSGFLFQSAF